MISSLMIEGANEAQEKDTSEVDIRTYALKLCEILDEGFEGLVKKVARPRIKQLILKTLDEEYKSLLKKPLSA